MGWLTTASGYEVALQSGTIVCRNAKGAVLRSVPSKVRQDPVTVGLRQTLEWLERHEAQCRSEIERWMVRSLPVPVAVLAQVWRDEAWRVALTDLVVAVPNDAGVVDPDEVGFLRGVASDGDGIGIVNLDGETVQLEATTMAIPHPVLLPEVDDLREFAADLGVKQSVEQLFRQTWARADDLESTKTSVSDYSGGSYRQLRQLVARASALGYPVRGGYAVCKIVEAGVSVEARSWVGSDDPSYETTTGDLVFVRAGGSTLLVGDVGPVTWSEGMRMASALYAGRVIETNEEAAA